MHRLTLIAALAPCLLFSPVARAQDATSQAREHFLKARAHYDRGEFHQAIVELKKAYELAPHPVVLYNLAKTYREVGDTDNALAGYKQYLDQAPDAPNADEVRTAIAELEAQREVSLPEIAPPPRKPARERPAPRYREEAQEQEEDYGDEEDPLEAARRKRMRRERGDEDVEVVGAGPAAQPFRTWKWVAAGTAGAVLLAAVIFRMQASGAASDLEGMTCSEGQVTGQDPDGAGPAPAKSCAVTFSRRHFDLENDIKNKNTLFAGFAIAGLLAGAAAGAMFYLDHQAAGAAADEEGYEDEYARLPVLPVVVQGGAGLAAGLRF